MANLPFNNKLMGAIYDCREALWSDLQAKLKYVDDIHGVPEAGITIVGKLHTMRDYIRLLDRIEKLAHDAGDTYHK